MWPIVNNLSRTFAKAVMVVHLFVLTVFVDSKTETLAQSRPEVQPNAPTWQFHSADCHLESGSWRRQTETVTGRSDVDPETEICERIDFACGNGTEVLIAANIEPVYVIPELEFALEVCAIRPNLQILIEVTFPHTKSPSGSGMLTTLLRGPHLNSAGEWGEIKMGGPESPITELLKEQVWVLRRKFSCAVNTHNAYVSKVLVNAYSSPGHHRLWLKPPTLSGAVIANPGMMVDPMVRDLDLTLVNFEDDDRRTPSRSQRQGTVIEIDRLPFFPKIVQYNGEPFEFLKQLGFNTIQLANTATPEELRRARELELWVICPPPPSTGLKPIGEFYDQIFAWSLGNNLTSQHLVATQNLARDIRKEDTKLNRPLFAHVESSWSSFAQTTDILSIGISPFGTNFPMRRYKEWIRKVSRTAGGNLPVCVDVQTEIPGQLIQQAGFMIGRISPTPIEREQIKTLIYEALAGGARAVRYLSRSRLDSGDPQTRLRAQTLTWLNRHLSLLEPWAVGGVVMGLTTLDNGGMEITTLKTNRGQLLLIEQQTGLEQYVAGDPALKTIRFNDTYSSISDQAFLLTDAGVVPLAYDRNTSGATIQIDSCGQTAAVVLTQNPAVLNRINQSIDVDGPTSQVNLRADLTRQWLAFTQIAENELSQMNRSTAAASGAYNEALNAFQQAENLIRTNSPVAALPFLELADQKLAFVRRELLGVAREQFTSETSAPLLSHVSLLPRHWELAAGIPSMETVPNALPGGDFENLEHMISNGWENTSSRDPNLMTRVELAPTAAGSGNSGLKLSATSNITDDSALDSIPLVIKSAPVSVHTSQLILIHGWVRIDAALTNSEDGLVVYDSIGGRALALRFQKTNGWQEFKLYRAAGENTDLRMTLELVGLGSAMVDEITVRAINLPATPSQPSTASRETNTTDK